MKPQQANRLNHRNTRGNRIAADEQAKRIALIALGPRFPLGRVVICPGAISLFADAFGLDAASRAADFLRRHASGDWGNVPHPDANSNDAALKNGGRILSAYEVTETIGQIDIQATVWIITDAEDDHRRRACTTILLPSEY